MMLQVEHVDPAVAEIANQQVTRKFAEIRGADGPRNEIAWSR
jgi:hypothetical protein